MRFGWSAAAFARVWEIYLMSFSTYTKQVSYAMADFTYRSSYIQVLTYVLDQLQRNVRKILDTVIK